MTATGFGPSLAGRRDEEFAEFVSTRSGWLRKVAYLLTGDWHRADDLAQATVTKLYVRWHRLGGVENVDGYARQTLVNSFLAERRSPWARVLLGRGENGGDGPPPVVPQPDLDAVLDLRRALAELPPRQRATVVLRYFCDLTVEQTAETLGCTPGTVKSQTARGLDALRRVLTPDSEPTATGGGTS
ncbi:SigE family RNA polymerase sigma factor [Streptacidiphilus jiangxiensis]|uniref:RNA polymerase sigma-70 factor, sigma-E family n=1 Tax=Streptacidiphilus jiangxiensis TaxID=235985 RepID=A0A1H7WSB6_STRJI|nr:SigE family RNA polymerase sigma factor [Streptacidiphilus jiangxiensis]SEM24145.1 RNA polymerase sigma-70 factor, sigma-E family [Streptacidiphilus jiangxiensis]